MTRIWLGLMILLALAPAAVAQSVADSAGIRLAALDYIDC
jgi:hypothetical protein